MVEVWEAAMEAVCAKLAACDVPTAAVAVAEALAEYLRARTIFCPCLSLKSCQTLAQAS